MADLFVAHELGQFLIASGVCRAWGTAGDLPQVIIDPREGVPQPGDPENAQMTAETCVVGIRRSGEIPPAWLMEQIEQDLVQVIVRAKKAQDAEIVQRLIKNLLKNRKLFMVGSLLVESCQQWAGVSPLGSDRLSFDTAQTFVFGVRVKALAGQNYAP